MKEYWAKYKFLIITIIIILAIVWAIYYFGKEEGSKYVPNDIVIPPDLQPNTSTIDENGNVVPITYTTPQGTIFNPGPYTDAIFRDLDCIFCFHDAGPYNDAMALSNSQLAAIYNDWNQRYSEKFDKQTLIQALEGDFSTWNLVWEHTLQDLVIRLKSIAGTQG